MNMIHIIDLTGSDGQMKYPCNLCIVLACCSIQCKNYYQFINQMADDLLLMTADEIHKFRTTTPFIVQKIVEVFLKTNTRYAYLNRKPPNKPLWVKIVHKASVYSNNIIGTGSV